MGINFPIGADATEFNKVIDASNRRLDELAKRSSEVTGMTEKAARLSFNKVLSGARMAWSAVDAVFQAMGINMGEQMRLLIQASFSAVSSLQAIYSAQLSNPYTAAFGAFSLGELLLAVNAIQAQQAQQAEIARQTAQTARAVFAVGTFLSGMANF